MPLVAVTWEIGLAVSLALALMVLVLVEVISGGAFRIFGPVLYYEMVRIGRRGRVFLLRCAYALFIFSLLMWIWSNGSYDFATVANRSRELARLAETFFYTFATVQFICVLLLTPGYVASCIADDKERRTLEFLLATDLANREIVFGKMAARVGNLLLFLLTGLPLLSLIQFFGGIDPGILLITFAATGLTMLGLAGVSIAQSVRRRKARDAILISFIIAIAYESLCQLLWLGLFYAKSPPGRVTLFGQMFLDLEPAIDVFRWGDPIRTIGEVSGTFALPAGVGAALMRILGEYATFHLTVFGLGVLYAVWRLRKIALRQAGGSESGRDKKGKRKRKRPSVSSRRPMVWKELWIEGRLRLGLFARIGLVLLLAAAFAPLGVAIYLHWFDTTSQMNYDGFFYFVNGWVRAMNIILGCLILLGIAVRAAGSVGGERDKDTLVSLLTTPVSVGEILYGKFIGALASVRGLVLWLCAVWFFGLITQSVSPIALPVEVYCLVTPAIAAASLGLFFSVACPTTLRAIMFTLGAMVFFLGAHWIVTGMCCFAPAQLSGVQSGLQHFATFQVGLTPPVTLGVVPVRPDEDWYVKTENSTYVAIAAVGNLCWLVVAAALGIAGHDRFAELTNRVTRSRPVTETDLMKAIP